MLKKFTLIAVLAFFSLTAFNQSFYKVDLNSQKEQESYFNIPDFTVHYYNDSFLIGSGSLSKSSRHHVFETTAWDKGKEYLLVWLPNKNIETYITEVAGVSEIIYKNPTYIIIKTDKENVNKLNPAVHNGLIKINRSKASLYIKDKGQTFKNTLNPDPLIEGYVAEVLSANVMADIQHLEDYGTRVYNTSEASLAEAWIQDEFESYGLPTELSSTGASGSMNVTATQTGMVFPNKFIMVGGHYDSTSNGSTAPGADDNASGTASVLEIARILSQYEFNYSIIYCAWSAEEIGLYGSGAWASNAASSGMDIIGYLNIDMTGYLHSGDDLHTDMVAPASAQDLVDFYYHVVDLYVTDFTVYDGNLTAGDSDHTSFNNNGFQGIFPCEEDNNYSPYIHTENDLIGLSVNSPEKAVKFTQAGVAFIAAGAEPFTGLYPPMNLVLVQNDNDIQLSWDAPLNTEKDFIEYKLYRNSEIYASISDLNQTSYTDASVENGITYEYYVTALYSGDPAGESNASNIVNATMGLNQIYFWDFEDGTQNWTILDNTLGWRWGVSISGLSGNNTEYLSIDSDAPGSGNHVFDYAISPELNLSSYSLAFLEFDYAYKDYSTDFMKLMYRTSPTSNWMEIETLSASSSFMNQSVELPPEALTENMQFSFYYDDNNIWAWYAAVDNVGITAAQTNSGISTKNKAVADFSVYPNPTKGIFSLNLKGFENLSTLNISINNILGKTILNKTITQQNETIDLSDFESGIYIISIQTETENFTSKIVKE